MAQLPRCGRDTLRRLTYVRSGVPVTVSSAFLTGGVMLLGGVLVLRDALGQL